MRCSLVTLLAGGALLCASQANADEPPMSTWFERSSDNSLAVLEWLWGEVATATTQNGAETAALLKNSIAAAKHLPGSMVGSSQVCFRKPDNQFDCATAARQICEKRGFRSGRALDVAYGERCRLTERPHRGLTRECKKKAWVTVAVCW